MQEQIVKTVVRSGNGGAVWVPKTWINEKIIVIRPEAPKLTMKEEIIKILEPFLEDISAVFLYGSYARGEQEKHSDIDILVVAKYKFIIKHKRFEINVITYDKLIKTIKENPIMYYPFIIESKAIINSKLLEDLKKIKIDYKKFSCFINDTEDIIKIDREFIEIDKLEGKYLKTYPVIYSLILRLRGVFLIKCIIEKTKYSSKNFKNWLLGSGLIKSDLDTIMDVYRLVRDNKMIKEEINISTIEILINMLEKEAGRLKIW